MDETAGEVSARKVRLNQLGTLEAGPTEVRTAEVRPGEFDPAEVRLGLKMG
jgi:hypothetical protein